MPHNSVPFASPPRDQMGRLITQAHERGALLHNKRRGLSPILATALVGIIGVGVTIGLIKTINVSASQIASSYLPVDGAQTGSTTILPLYESSGASLGTVRLRSSQTKQSVSVTATLPDATYALWAYPTIGQKPGYLGQLTMKDQFAELVLTQRTDFRQFANFALAQTTSDNTLGTIVGSTKR